MHRCSRLNWGRGGRCQKQTIARCRERRTSASDTKSREDARLSLRPSTARARALHLTGRGPLSSALGLGAGWRSAELLRSDLDRAGISYTDESGRTFDFHVLRGQAATRPLEAGASPKVVQRAMRHATSELTVGLYATLRPEEERRALDMLGDLAPTSSKAARAIGTDGAGNCSASCSAFPSASDRTLPHSAAPSNPSGDAENAFAARGLEPEAGFEPATPALRKQCSTVELLRLAETRCPEGHAPGVRAASEGVEVYAPGRRRARG